MSELPNYRRVNSCRNCGFGNLNEDKIVCFVNDITTKVSDLHVCDEWAAISHETSPTPHKVWKDGEYDAKRKSHIVCYYCGLEDSKVEAGGLWHCPNTLCKGPGNQYFLRSLKSFKELGDGYCQFDTKEWIKEANEYLSQKPELFSKVKELYNKEDKNL